MMAKVIDITGMKFNRLTVIRMAGSGHHGEKVWECICDCGNTTYATGSQLRGGRVKSCGCLQLEQSKAQMKMLKRFYPAPCKTHGDSRTRMYGIWAGMLQRCTNPKRESYPLYGGRGISVCERWKNYENFKSDMGASYFDGASIDRIDNEKGYSPENCRWVELRAQASNRRKKIRVHINGKEITVKEAASILHVNKRTLYKWVEKGAIT